MNWMWSSPATKSIAKFTKLVDIIRSPLFRKEDLTNFDVHRETTQLDKMAGQSKSQDGWTEETVHIHVPDGKIHDSEDDAPSFPVLGLHYWQKPNSDNPPELVSDELYSLPAFILEYENVQKLPRQDDLDNYERVVLGLMWWSDSTHFTSFGNASLWPLYLFFGNQSKYERCKPSSGGCNHIAYIPKIPFLIGLRLKREKVQLQIFFLTFMEAYHHGIVIRCFDGIERRFFPRFFTYAADYPEKVLLSLIRNWGKFLCPRCVTPQDKKITDLGTVNDEKRRERLKHVDDNHRVSRVALARNWIYKQGCAAKSAAVERLLAVKSEVPTMNAFSQFLQAPGFNFYSMLVVDLMHEFELGVWKMTFIHLIRILVAHGGTSVQELNCRQVPPFGRSTIRRFKENVSAMKKLAVRDFEDILQCSIPVFEGLLPEPYNSVLLELLFTLAEWHALAKLRIHTESTLGLLHNSTHSLGQLLRRFKLKISESLPFTHLEQHYHTSHSQNLPHNLHLFIHENVENPEAKDFCSKLEEHVLSRIQHPTWTGDGNEFTAAERANVIFQRNQFYSHRVLRINYTTYDM
ncbi:hypothetical protein BT96DRAFT_1000039 [Gymnopus androsaceus JB14]|uniref:Uncharacterized protein n=1 Tax=Gymnopus androsaceus JB14 TaxID=1447944 RepID=A0A6A4H4Y5_9AGAR|nr:hypothetical protein BT96DRAFT_1000039 [Gymnopus androsaceus JB14]